VQRPLLWTAIGLIALLIPSIWWMKVMTVDPVDVSSDSERVQLRSADDALRFAIAPVLPPETTNRIYRNLAGYLSEQLGRPVQLVQRKTYTEVNELLRLQKVHFGLICPGAYMKAHIDGLQIEVLQVPYGKQGAMGLALTVVRADSLLQDFQDLSGRVMALSDPLSLAGYLYPLILASERGYSARGFAENALLTYSYDSSIHAVLDGAADAAAVDAMFYEYEMMHSQNHSDELRVLHRSEGLPGGPMVVPTSLDTELKKQLRLALVGMTRSARGRSVLMSLGIEGFGDPPPDLYDPMTQRVIDLYSDLERDP